MSLQLPSVPVNSKQQGLIELYKDAYIQKKVNKDKPKQDPLDSIYTKILNELRIQKIEEIHITSARKEADKIAHDEFIDIYFDVYKDLLYERTFFKETNNDTLLKVQESQHEFVYSKAKHILGSEKIEEIRSIAHKYEAKRIEDEAKKIANLFPSVPTKKPTLKKRGEKRKKTKKKKTRKGKKQKRRK